MVNSLRAFSGFWVGSEVSCCNFIAGLGLAKKDEITFYFEETIFSDAPILSKTELLLSYIFCISFAFNSRCQRLGCFLLW